MNKMSTSLGKRLLSFLLVAVMVLGLVPVVASPQTQAASVSTVTKDEIITLRNYAETLGWPVAVKTTGLTTSSDMTGHWMILVERSGGNMYTVNMSSPESICVENNTADPRYLYGVTYVTNQGAVDALHSMPQTHILSFSGTGSSFSIRNYKKQYWCIENINRGETSDNNTTSYDLRLYADSSKAARFKLATSSKIQSTAGVWFCPNGHSFQAASGYYGNPLYFYKFSDFTINLRLSMLDALPYLIDNSEGRFSDADAYNDLIAAMKAAVEAYSVHYDTVESALSAETKTELENLNNELQTAIDLVKRSDTGDRLADLRNKINSALWPYADGVLGSRDTITTGRYIIAASRDGAESPQYGVNSDANPDGWVTDSDAHITRGIETVLKDNYGDVSSTAAFYSARPTSQRSIVMLSGSGSSCTIQHYNGLYWNMSNNTHWHDAQHNSPTTWSDFNLSSTPTTFWILDGNYGFTYRICCTVGSVTNIIYSNGHTYRVKTRPEDRSDAGYNLYLYKFNDEALDLRLALQEGLDYLVEDYATRFDEAAFDALCEKLNDVYYKFDTKDEVVAMRPYVMTETKKRDYKKLTEEVLNAIAAVQRSDNEGADYIDIPIEILDFRGDGFLFENGGDRPPYALSTAPLGRGEANFPGYADGSGAVVGLTYDKLVDGNVVYTRATVDYIASHLKSKTTLITPANQMNAIFFDLVNNSKLTDGSYDATIAKCEPAIEGGRLAWNDVKTWHDLAYYMLSNMWRSSEDNIGTDTLAAEAPYNMPIDEMDHLRLYKGSDGKYSFLSNKMSSAGDGYIQNVTDKALTIRRFDPMFQPLNNKGFESPDLYGTATEGASDNANNYLFTMHAYGSFVYTESANLNFTFDGDDDVYFYVNGTRICDIGGMHDAVSKSVNLNDYAATLNLRDGQICRFDMFYAERHTTGINLNFTTNIQLMDESVITDKLQYEAATGKQLMDGAIVNTGTELTYAFGMTNRRSEPVKELQFNDSVLGVRLDGKDELIKLNDATQLSDLILTYSTYDVSTGAAYSGKATVYDSYDDFYAFISAAVNDSSTATPLKTGAYSYTPKSEAELIGLLKLGIPATAKLTVYGLGYIANSDTTNNLTTDCTPVEYVLNADGTMTRQDGSVIHGTASCTCNVMSVADVSALVGDPYAVVLDFGKSAQVDLTQVQSTLPALPSGVTAREFIGYTFNGAHGTIKQTAPVNLTFTRQGQTMDADTHRFTMVSDSVVRFTPRTFIEQTHNFYAVYKITQSDGVYYIMRAVSFMPATTVYYETDFDKDIVEPVKANGLMLSLSTSENLSWGSTNGVAAGYSNANGILSGTVNGGDPWITLLTTLSSTYTVKATDVVKMRIKADAGHNTDCEIFFKTSDNNSWSEDYATRVTGYTTTGDWQTITMTFQKPANMTGDTIKQLRIDPFDNSGAVKGKFEIDWVYIGPDVDIEGEETLFFDFDGSDPAVTWTSYGYGITSWTTGVLTGSLPASGHSTTPGAGLKTNTNAFGYILKENDVVKVRFRTGDAVSSPTKHFILSFDNGAQAQIDLKDESMVTFADWTVMTFKDDALLKNYYGRQVIGIEFIPFSHTYTTGTYEIDWMYIGPDSETDSEFGFKTTSTDASYAWEHIGAPHSSMQTPWCSGDTDAVYGYDSSYENAFEYSNNSTYHVEGVGVPLMAYKKDENDKYVLDEDGKKIMVINYSADTPYTDASFTFTGTGFDIISRTGSDQGAIRVVVCAPNGDVKKTASVLNKGVTFYQIPVVSVEGLDYGTYTVHIFVNAPYDFDDSSNNNAFNGALDRGGEFYFDAVRIYNPIATADAYKVYQAHGEYAPTFKELRDILIDASKDITDATMDGVVYLESGETTNKIAEYKAIGPNNEVYLAPGNSIAFKLEVTGTIPSSIDIGVKSVDGNAVAMRVYMGTIESPYGVHGDNDITSTTAMFDSLNFPSFMWQTSDGKSYIYVTISNTGTSGILSISDIKYAYSAAVAPAEERSVKFLVEPAMLEALANVCNHVLSEGVITPPTCTMDGYTTYTCTVCGDSYTADEVAALGHSYNYTNNGETHTASCASCDDSATEVHSYVDGTCICGATEIVEPKYEYSEKLSTSMGITVGAEMQISYTILDARIKDYESFYVEIVKEVAGGESITTVYSLDANNLTDMLNPNTGAHVGYYAIYSGIKASQMGDEFSATLYAVAADGTIYYGPTNASSIKSFLYEKIANEATLPELKTLAVDMLNYGAAAQVYFGYDAENLVNADLTEEQKALGTQEIPAAVDTSTSTGDGGAIIPNVTLESKVVLYVNCRYEAKEDSNLVVVIKDMDGNVIDEVIPKILTAKICQAAYSNVGAKQMRQPIQIEMYDNGTLVTQTLTWSIESYVAQTRASNSASEALLNAVNAMLTYGDSAASYLTATGQ